MTKQFVRATRKLYGKQNLLNFKTLHDTSFTCPVLFHPSFMHLFIFVFVSIRFEKKKKKEQILSFFACHFYPTLSICILKSKCIQLSYVSFEFQFFFFFTIFLLRAHFQYVSKYSKTISVENFSYFFSTFQWYTFNKFRTFSDAKHCFTCAYSILFFEMISISSYFIFCSSCCILCYRFCYFIPSTK